MAKTAKAKTPVTIAADKARDAYKKAKEANTKADNATTQKALADAKTARDTAVTAESRERFLTIGNARVLKASAALSQIGKMNQPRSYIYNEEDLAKAEKLLADANKNAFNALRAAISGKKESGDSAPVNVFA